MLTKQQVFDKVVERLMDGRGRCSIPAGCVYLNREGNRCAVGIFLKGHISENILLENNSHVSTILRYDNVPKWMNKNMAFLERIQKCHDRVDNWEDNKFIGFDSLNKLAEHYDLDYTSPTATVA